MMYWLNRVLKKAVENPGPVVEATGGSDKHPLQLVRTGERVYVIRRLNPLDKSKHVNVIFMDDKDLAFYIWNAFHRHVLSCELYDNMLDRIIEQERENPELQEVDC